MNQMRRPKRNTITKPVLREIEKEMGAKNTGLPGRNNFLLNHAARCLASAAKTDAKAYLALNWKRVEIRAFLTWRDQRFPTPQLATRHLFWPKQRRKAASSLRNWRPILISLRNKSRRRDPPGGIRLRHIRRKPRRKSAHGIFALTNALSTFHEHRSN